MSSDLDWETYSDHCQLNIYLTLLFNKFTHTYVFSPDYIYSNPYQVAVQCPISIFPPDPFLIYLFEVENETLLTSRLTPT